MLIWTYIEIDCYMFSSTAEYYAWLINLFAMGKERKIHASIYGWQGNDEIIRISTEWFIKRALKYWLYKINEIYKVFDQNLMPNFTFINKNITEKKFNDDFCNHKTIKWEWDFVMIPHLPSIQKIEYKGILHSNEQEASWKRLSNIKNIYMKSYFPLQIIK